MAQHAQVTETDGAPWEKAWARDGIETLGKCPVCNSSLRDRAYADLVDNSFFCAPGKWSMWLCRSCQAAYLDPRPTPETIGLAYASYYTHGQNKHHREEYGQLSTLRKIRRRLVNGYTNWRFCTKEGDANRFGIALANLIPPLRGKLENEYRNIPRIRPKNATLLDLGCGDGTYLDRGRKCGWKVVGVDPDERAVEAARGRGFDVHHGGIEVFDGQEALFDHITMNHVIEHLHDPTEVLSACFRLLKPGGRIWLDAPNIQSYGHAYFGQYWRGLETPRHLVMFSRKAMYLALSDAGFNAIRQMPDRNVYRGVYAMSHAIRSGHRPEDATALPLFLELKALLARVSGAINPRRREFLTLTAQKA